MGRLLASFPRDKVCFEHRRGLLSLHGVAMLLHAGSTLDEHVKSSPLLLLENRRSDGGRVAPKNEPESQRLGGHRRGGQQCGGPLFARYKQKQRLTLEEPT